MISRELTQTPKKSHILRISCLLMILKEPSLQDFDTENGTGRKSLLTRSIIIDSMSLVIEEKNHLHHRKERLIHSLVVKKGEKLNLVEINLKSRTILLFLLKNEDRAEDILRECISNKSFIRLNWQEKDNGQSQFDSVNYSLNSQNKLNVDKDNLID